MTTDLLSLSSGVALRLALALLFVAAILAVGLFSRSRLRRRHAKVMQIMRLVPISENRPRLLTFCGPACAACRTQQAIVEGLRARWPGGFDLEVLDATTSALAGPLGIVTVPATVVAAPSGRVVAINCGWAQASRLEPQLRAASASRDPAEPSGVDRDRDDDAHNDAA